MEAVSLTFLVTLTLNPHTLFWSLGERPVILIYSLTLRQQTSTLSSRKTYWYYSKINAEFGELIPTTYKSTLRCLKFEETEP